MNLDAIKTIRIHNYKWNKVKATKFANNFINIISKKYPAGLDSNVYFVLPGFEHVTKHQPIVEFNPVEGIWELSTTDLFKQPLIK